MNTFACVFMKSASMYNMYQTIFIYRFQLEPNTASFYGNIPYIAGILISPCIGFFIDKIGNHLTWSIIGNITCILSNILLSFDPECPHLGIHPLIC